MHTRPFAYSDAIRLGGTLLISTGAALLLFVFMTVQWGDPFTRVGQSREQSRLKSSFKQQSARFTPPAQPTTANLGPLDARRTAPLARSWKAQIKHGEVAGRIIIPSIGMRKYVVKGASHDDLSKGPGIYHETGFPGSGQPVAIAGHRTTFGAPFLNIDRLKRGSKIILQMPYATITYRVSKQKIISPTDWSIIEVGAWRKHAGSGCRGGTCEHLVLTACHPKYSAKQRLAVFAIPESVKVTARGGGSQ